MREQIDQCITDLQGLANMCDGRTCHAMIDNLVANLAAIRKAKTHLEKLVEMDCTLHHNRSGTSGWFFLVCTRYTSDIWESHESMTIPPITTLNALVDRAYAKWTSRAADRQRIADEARRAEEAAQPSIDYANGHYPRTEAQILAIGVTSGALSAAAAQASGAYYPDDGDDEELPGPFPVTTCGRKYWWADDDAERLERSTDDDRELRDWVEPADGDFDESDEESDEDIQRKDTL